jgi:hypothetical protein
MYIWGFVRFLPLSRISHPYAAAAVVVTGSGIPRRDRYSIPTRRISDRQSSGITSRISGT